jgi:hypothetical protein
MSELRKAGGGAKCCTLELRFPVGKDQPGFPVGKDQPGS